MDNLDGLPGGALAPPAGSAGSLRWERMCVRVCGSSSHSASSGSVYHQVNLSCKSVLSACGWTVQPQTLGLISWIWLPIWAARQEDPRSLWIFLSWLYVTRGSVELAHAVLGIELLVLQALRASLLHFLVRDKLLHNVSHLQFVYLDGLPGGSLDRLSGSAGSLRWEPMCVRVRGLDTFSSQHSFDLPAYQRNCMTLPVLSGSFWWICVAWEFLTCVKEEKFAHRLYMLASGNCFCSVKWLELSEMFASW